MIDSQVVELLGKNYLINQLLQAGVEAANPVRDSGIDLIAYLNKEDLLKNGYAARPIQIKASSARMFSIDKKYAKFPQLLLTFIWHLNDGADIEVYCLDYAEALGIADRMGYTKTQSWARGVYTTTRPSGKLLGLLAPFKMVPENWGQRLRAF